MVHVYEKDDDWWLVKGTSDGGRVGLVPGNYVEETVRAVNPYTVWQQLTMGQGSGSSLPASDYEDNHPGPSVQPTSRPSYQKAANGNNYHDPAELVAQSHLKAKADPIETWAVTVGTISKID